jgi:sirohydrochlorin ferrochelatase
MSAAGFNTLEAAEDLQSAGMDEAHAKAIVSTVYRAMNEGVATKEHVTTEIGGAESRLRAEIAGLRSDMLKTAIGIVVTNVTITVALLKLIP